LFTWREFHERLEQIAHASQVAGTPAELNELGRGPIFQQPKDHLRLGTGKRRLVLNVGVHPNEPLGMVTAIWIADYFARNPELLEKYDLTLDVVCSDPDGLILNDGWIRLEKPSLIDYAYNSYRDWHIARLDASRNAGNPSEALTQLYENLPEDHNVIAFEPLHHQPLGTGAYAFSGRFPHLPRWIHHFVRNARRTTGLIAHPSLIEGHDRTTAHHDSPYVFDILRVAGLQQKQKGHSNRFEVFVPPSDVEVMEDRYAGIACFFTDSPLWRPTRISKDLRGLTMADTRALAAERSREVKDWLGPPRKSLPLGISAYPVTRPGVIGIRNYFLHEIPSDYAVDEAIGKDRKTDVAFDKGAIPPDVAFHIAHVFPAFSAYQLGQQVQFIEAETLRPTSQRFSSSMQPQHELTTELDGLYRLGRHLQGHRYTDRPPAFLLRRDITEQHRIQYSNALETLLRDTIDAGEVEFIGEKAAHVQINATMRGFECALGLRSFELCPELTERRLLNDIPCG
jgi:hypothetical protein